MFDLAPAVAAAVTGAAVDLTARAVLPVGYIAHPVATDPAGAAVGATGSAVLPVSWLTVSVAAGAARSAVVGAGATALAVSWGALPITTPRPAAAPAAMGGARRHTAQIPGHCATKRVQRADAPQTPTPITPRICRYSAPVRGSTRPAVVGAGVAALAFSPDTDSIATVCWTRPAVFWAPGAVFPV